MRVSGTAEECCRNERHRVAGLVIRPSFFRSDWKGPVANSPKIVCFAQLAGQTGAASVCKAAEGVVVELPVDYSAATFACMSSGRAISHTYQQDQTCTWPCQFLAAVPKLATKLINLRIALMRRILTGLSRAQTHRHTVPFSHPAMGNSPSRPAFGSGGCART